jgi:CDP-L-myo-inositol myo-inositolphosphotransferase
MEVAPAVHGGEVPLVVLFDSAEDAEWRIAGAPAAARICRELVQAGCPRLVLAIGGERLPRPAVAAEIERLAPGSDVRIIPEQKLAAEFATAPERMIRLVSGRFLARAPDIERWFRSGGNWCAEGQPIAWMSTTWRWRQLPPRRGSFSAGPGAATPVSDAGRLLIRQTAKPSDGIVSRWLNRPVSQRISAILLRIPGLRPVHATMLTAVTTLAMFMALVLGGAHGLLMGGILFHLASVLDGVDGEIARATFRSSRLGAALDTGVDMATNLMFVAGVAINLWLGGREGLALVAVGALVALAGGIALLGWLVRRSRHEPSFNLLKNRIGNRLSGRWSAGIGKILVFVTSRDFFAFFFLVMFALGLEAVAVQMFAVSAFLWFLFVAVAAPVLIFRSWRQKSAPGDWQMEQVEL